MEPFTGSSQQDDNLAVAPSFLQHRGKAMSHEDVANLSLLHPDSGYVSTYSTTQSTPNFSSNLSVSTTPHKSSNNSSHLITVSESSESIKLTPVTQNIRKICDFHITTPKIETSSSSTLAPVSMKRTSTAALNFEQYQNTPKRIKLNYDTKTSAIAADASLTPHYLRKSRSAKKGFRNKLRSASELEGYFRNHDIENDISPRRSEISPICNRNYTRAKRTPLSSTSANYIQSSTPKSCGNRQAGKINDRPASVKKLLSFSDQQFEALINTGTKQVPDCVPMQDAETPNKSDLLIKLSEPFETPNRDEKNSTDFYQEQSFSEYKRLYPLINSVLMDRENAKRRANEARLVQLGDDSTAIDDDVSVLDSSSLLLQRPRKLARIDGFEETLSSSDMEISSIQLPAGTKVSGIAKDDNSQDNNANKTKFNLQLDSGIHFEFGILTPEEELDQVYVPKTTTTQGNNNNTLGCESMVLISPTQEPGISDIVGVGNSNIMGSRNRQSPSRNYTYKTDHDIQLNSTIICDSFEENVVRKFIDTKFVPNTPPKRKMSSADHERFEIMYPTIPKTPSKKSTTIISGVNVRRKLLTDTKTRKFYNGTTHLNIISKLEPYTLVLDRIFNLLSSQDLLSLTLVSKSLRKIVRSNQRASVKLSAYLKEWKRTKENDGERKCPDVIVIRRSSVSDAKKNQGNRLPFSHSNLRVDRKRLLDTYKSPPVSPSKRKFHENQKVVRTLADNECLTKCPRCAKSSRIINTPQTEQILSHHSSNNNNNFNNNFSISSNLLRSHRQSFQATSTFFSVNTINNNNNNNNNNNSNNNNNDGDYFSAPSLSQPISGIPTTLKSKSKLIKSMSADSSFLPATFMRHGQQPPFQPFGECSGLGCRFRFCLECLCEYHPGSRCKISERTSPTKEDMQNGILQLSSPYSAVPSRSLKSRRKSLKRLCF